MNKIKKLQKIELEISNQCNAACPGCARTRNLDLISENAISLKQIKKIFPTSVFIKNKIFKLCGVLGDPVVNSECYEIVEYLIQNGGWCQISTNGAIQTENWWKKLGSLSYNTKNLEVNFCIDGHKNTNHIYRVNTVWSKLEKNIKAYRSTYGIGSWIYIVFEHNECELEIAKQHSKELGLQFCVRTGMRNSFNTWISEIKKKENQQIKKEEVTINVSKDNQHSKVNIINNLNKIFNVTE